MALLDVRELCFSWPGREVLRGIDFKVEPNQLVSVLGVNGAGKTTLLKCINRILSQSSGTVRLQSNDMSTLPLMNVARHIAYVPQSVGTNFPMSVFDVVLLGRRPHLNWFVGEADREKVSESLHYLNLKEFAFRRYDQLSGGERQRVVLAKALAQDPDLYLLDEPTSDLDLKNQIVIMEKLVALVKNTDRASSALVAIHDIDMAARFSDKILLLHEGVIHAFGSPQEVLTPKNIGEVFGVEAEIVNNSSLMRIIIKGAMRRENEV